MPTASAEYPTVARLGAWWSKPGPKALMGCVVARVKTYSQKRFRSRSIAFGSCSDPSRERTSCSLAPVSNTGGVVSRTITILLLFFAALGFAGAGIAFAIGRARELADGYPDLGMRSLAVMLLGFGAACTFLATSLSGVLAVGGVVAWVSYILSAQRIGVFQIERWRPLTGSVAERRPIA
jgi:hypothetical protein